ncbi:MAG: hypothetical protein H6849_00670 [Alphaproteobacteria bacterium]|nr:MAG: hypothetical protein H6849_00670 [Alphaproteobacteria bacterium]
MIRVKPIILKTIVCMWGISLACAAKNFDTKTLPHGAHSTYLATKATTPTLSAQNLHQQTFENVSFTIRPTWNSSPNTGNQGSTFMLGVGRRATAALPRASLKFQTPLYGTSSIRKLLRINGRDSTSLFMRFDFDKSTATSNSSGMFHQATKEALHYGPSVGVQVTLTPRFNVEAEYNPKFGLHHSETNSGSGNSLRSKIKNKLHKVERVDEFRVRINMHFGNTH